jgi:hypothetical protein
MQSCCVEADLPPLAEQDILDALVAVEEAMPIRKTPPS